MRIFACLVLLLGVSSLAIAADPDPDKGTINGSVVGGDGAGLADIPVKMFYAKDPNKKISLAEPPRPPGMDPVAETRTGKDGKFKFENVAPGEYMLIGGDQLKGLGRAPASVKAGKAVEVKI